MGVLKSVPHDTEAERAVLGSLVLDRDAIVKVAPYLEASHFYHDAHQLVYAAVQALFERREPPDPVTLGAELNRRGQLEQVGGMAALVSLIDSVPTAVHIEHYANIVERCAVLRRLISAGGNIAGLGWSEKEDVEEILGDADRLLLDVSAKRGKGGYLGMGSMVNSYADRLELISANPGHVTGLASGFPALNSYTGGYQSSKLVVLAARPGHGKTSFVLNEAKTIARTGVGVGFFSLEMSSHELMERWYSDEARIDSKQLRTGRDLSDQDWARITNASSRLADLPIHVDDTASLTISQLRATAFRMKAEQGIGLLVVDYLGLVQAPRKDGNRAYEVGEVARKLKILARELDIPVIACAQLNREVEKRQSHVPVLSDLRDSGEVEQHADIVIFIHRPELYEPDKVENIGKAELHIAKQRSGPLGMIPLRFVKELTTFHPVTRVYGEAA